jgi:DNA-binding beta-propeller fold protein YncE
MFAINTSTGELDVIGWESTRGEWPRGMNIDPSGTFLYAANQNTDTIAVFRIQDSNGKLKFSTLVQTPTPVDVEFGSVAWGFLSTGWWLNVFEERSSKQLVGEMSLLDGGPRSATIVAETPVRLLVISRRNFSVLLKDVPGLTESLLMTLSRRVRQAEERAERMGGALAGLWGEGGTQRTHQG